MSRCENYVEDIPMRLSRKFVPFNYQSEALPDVRSHESLMREFTYEFNAELCALEVADRRSREICDEAEKVRQKQLMQQQELEMKHRCQQQQPQNQTQHQSQSLPHQIQNQRPPPQHQQHPEAIPRPHSVPTLHYPDPLQVLSNSHSSHPSIPPLQPLRLKAIDTKEFEEVVGSSPFDDALLRSIDDRSELNSVFANVNHHSSSNSGYYNNAANILHGANRSPQNHLNP